MLRDRGIAQLIVCGVTTEVCVNTTVREANDRGFDCLVAERLRRLVFPEFQEIGLGDDQGAGRHLRLGRAVDGVARRAAPQPALQEAAE